MWWSFLYRTSRNLQESDPALGAFRQDFPSFSLPSLLRRCWILLVLPLLWDVTSIHISCTLKIWFGHGELRSKILFYTVTRSLVHSQIKRDRDNRSDSLSASNALIHSGRLFSDCAWRTDLSHSPSNLNFRSAYMSLNGPEPRGEARSSIKSQEYPILCARTDLSFWSLQSPMGIFPACHGSVFCTSPRKKSRRLAIKHGSKFADNQDWTLAQFEMPTKSSEEWSLISLPQLENLIYLFDSYTVVTPT